MRRIAVLGIVLWAFAAAAELPVGEQILHTKDGREPRGTRDAAKRPLKRKAASSHELAAGTEAQDARRSERPGVRRPWQS